jgi:hypothetical protein
MCAGLCLVPIFVPRTAKECQGLPTNQAISNDILALALAAKLYFDVRFSGWHWHWLPAYILACTLIVYGYVGCQIMPMTANDCQTMPMTANDYQIIY